MQTKEMKKVLTFGVYDLLHIGHILLFKHAKEKGDFLTVAVQDGGYIQKYKPNAKIINTTDERRMMVASIRFVDEVVTYKDVDKDILNLDFDVFAIGPDQNHEGFQKAIEWCKANGKEVVVIPRTEGISSSLLREFANIRKNSCG
jgi:cytidyltransferase-like protein